MNSKVRYFQSLLIYYYDFVSMPWEFVNCDGEVENIMDIEN